MKDFLKRIKRKIFTPIELEKIKRLNYSDLLRYENFKKINNKLIFSFGAGRCGQNWFSKIFNHHSNWVGTCERFADYEAFYRYSSYYNLPVNHDEFFNLLELSSNRDMSIYQNSFIASSYLSFGVKELTQRIKPNYIFFNLRDPKKSVESIYKKGWYLFYDNKKQLKSPLIDTSHSQYRSFSRIIPKNDFLDKWVNLTRIGKVTWFWATINKSIFDQIKNIDNTELCFIKLEDFNQNYEAYLRLAEKFKFKEVLSKRNYLGIISKTENRSIGKKYLYENWNELEKKEFKEIIDEIFPHYEEIKSNI